MKPVMIFGALLWRGVFRHWCNRDIQNPHRFAGTPEVVLYEIIAILVCMRDVHLTEKLTRFVGSLYERIRDWEFRHPWVARPFWYFILLVVVLIVCHGAFNHFELYHTDADSARYMLSAMVQAQAAIIAIVITLTLIAVQLTASAYSPRVICVFKKNPDMWLLLGFYGLSMLYGLVILKMVVGGAEEIVSQYVFWSHGFVSISPETCVSSAYWLEVFTFVALFPYMLNIIGLLKPENIIKRLAIEITEEGILKSKEDPIQPIMDIIHGAVMKYDIATTRVGLKAVTSQVIKIINVNGEQGIPMRFFAHLKQVSRLTVSKMDDESTGEVIKNWGDVLKEMAGEKCDSISHTDIINFESFVASITKEEFMHAASCAAESFGALTKIVIDAEKYYLTVASSLCALGKLGILAAEKNWDSVVLGVYGSLLQIGTTLTGGSIRNKKKMCRVTAYYGAQLEIFLEKIDMAYTPLIKPEDQESFNEFKKQCEHELNKLRTQKPN